MYLYLYTSDDADMSASIHIYNICIGSRFLKILVRRRLPLRLFETVAPLGGWEMGCAGAINPLLYDFCVPPTHGMYNNTPLIAQKKKKTGSTEKKIIM